MTGFRNWRMESLHSRGTGITVAEIKRAASYVTVGAYRGVEAGGKRLFNWCGQNRMPATIAWWAAEKRLMIQQPASSDDREPGGAGKPDAAQLSGAKASGNTAGSAATTVAYCLSTGVSESMAAA